MKMNSKKEGNPGTYSQKLANQTVIGVANEKRALVEPYDDVLDEFIQNLQFHANLWCVARFGSICTI